MCTTQKALYNMFMIQGHRRLIDLTTYYNMVDPLVMDNIRGVHIDLRLGPTLKRYIQDVDLLGNDPAVETFQITDAGFLLRPGDFVLGSTLETVEIPLGYYGFIETKGNISRAGLSSHNTDGHVDPGFRGKLTLEIKNNANVNVRLYPGIKFVQLFVWRVEGETTLYRGRYSGHEGPTAFQRDTLQPWH